MPGKVKIVIHGFPLEELEGPAAEHNVSVRCWAGGLLLDARKWEASHAAHASCTGIRKIGGRQGTRAACLCPHHKAEEAEAV